MNIIQKEELITRLVGELEFSQNSAWSTADELLNLHNTLQAEFLQWWHTGKLPEVVVEGYTVASLMTEYQMQPIAAILTLDWLIREPEDAKASLAYGYDEVVDE